MSFGVNVLGIKGPRKMTAVLPRLDDGGTAVTGFRPSPYGGNALLDRRAACAGPHCNAEGKSARCSASVQ